MTSSLSVTRGFIHKNRHLLSLASAALLAELAYAVLNLSAMPVYVTYGLKRGPAVGLVMSTFLLAEALARPAFGALGDRIGRKPLLMAGPAVTAITSYLTIELHGPYVLFALVGLRAVDGLGSGAFLPSAFAAVGDIIEEKNRSTAMSVLNATYMAALALGFLAGGSVNELFGTHAASFYLVSGLLVASLLVLVFLFPSRIEPRHSHLVDLRGFEQPGEFRYRELLRGFKGFPDMLALACVVFLGIGMLMPVAKLFAMQQFGMTETEFGWAVAPVAAFMAAFSVPLGRVGDKYGKTVAVCWGLFGSALAMWVLALSNNVLLSAAAGAVLGLGFTVAFPAWMALVSTEAGKARHGEALGAFGMAQGLSAIVGASIGGYVYHTDLFSLPRLGIVNFSVPFWFSAILLSVGTVMSFVWTCRRHRPYEAGPGITARQRRFILAAAALGTLGICAWVGIRYTQPVPPDRIAWCWVQQLVGGRVRAALAYADTESNGWEIQKEAARAAERYSRWMSVAEARYHVLPPKYRGTGRAEVPVRFVAPGRHLQTETILLRRSASGEWRVYGVRAGN